MIPLELVLVSYRSRQILTELLKRGPLRFNQMKESLNGITSRTLSWAMNRLISANLVQKETRHQGRYSLTSKGKKMAESIARLEAEFA